MFFKQNILPKVLLEEIRVELNIWGVKKIGREAARIFCLQAENSQVPLHQV